jgi:Plasmid stabilization system protein
LKKFNVFIDTNAEDDLFDIYSYVALNDSIEHADKIFTALRNTCFKLRTAPLRGNVPPELFEIGVTEFREIHNNPYRIIYSIVSTSVYIHCILDGRRDVQTILQERLLR